MKISSLFDVYESGFDAPPVCNIYFTIMRKNRQGKDNVGETVCPVVVVVWRVSHAAIRIDRDRAVGWAVIGERTRLRRPFRQHNQAWYLASKTK